MRSIRTLVTALAVLGAVAVAPSVAQAQVTATKSSYIGYQKYMQTTAKEYTNGVLTVDNYLRNESWWYGMRPQTLVVTVDNRGRAIWVSKVFQSATVCGVLDPTCASQRREFFSDSRPAVIGQHAARLDILHADNPNYRNLRNDLIDAIKSATDVADEIRRAWEQLRKS